MEKFWQLSNFYYSSKYFGGKFTSLKTNPLAAEFYVKLLPNNKWAVYGKIKSNQIKCNWFNVTDFQLRRIAIIQCFHLEPERLIRLFSTTIFN